MTKMHTDKRSYLAAVLSMVFPGMGQIYLRRPLEGVMLCFGVVFAGAIIYLNSHPVTCWRDLTYIEGVENWLEDQTGIHLAPPQRGGPESVLLIRLPNGTQVRYRPTWHFKVSGLIQGLIFWIYAIFDGWRGQRGAFRKGEKRKSEEHVDLMVPRKQGKPAKLSEAKSREARRIDRTNTTHGEPFSSFGGG